MPRVAYSRAEMAAGAALARAVGVMQAHRMLKGMGDGRDWSKDALSAWMRRTDLPNSPPPKIVDDVIVDPVATAADELEAWARSLSARSTVVPDAGELLRLTAETGERRTAEQGRPEKALHDETLSTLADLGISRVQSDRWLGIVLHALTDEPDGPIPDNLADWADTIVGDAESPEAWEAAHACPLLRSNRPYEYVIPDDLALLVAEADDYLRTITNV